MLCDPWKIIESKFNPKFNRIAESIFAIGNGYMGGRANFEEQYSGDSLLGNYLAGIYYPDKTRVGWWKNGYPEYFAKVLNSVNWIGIDIKIGTEILDLSKCTVEKFRRELDMKNGILKRHFIATLKSGRKIAVHSTRFLSIVDQEFGLINYKIKPLNFSGKITLIPHLDFDVVNEDSNYGEKFWDEVSKKCDKMNLFITASTKKTDFHVTAGMHFEIENKKIHNMEKIYKEKYIAGSVKLNVKENSEISLNKYVVILTSENYKKSELFINAKKKLPYATKKSFAVMLSEHQNAWAKKWEESDIQINGDELAEQAIRFNIFQLNQTYTGTDSRLNIGPKGFTGEKYGGTTYWDTEAYCLPFYLATADDSVAKNLLLYRYYHLPKAIENAKKLGFTNGAALYPMVTVNGEECHNEWEITFEEIHRNGAIAYAIYDYVNFTGDEDYLCDYGLEVLIALSRFWAQRVNWSEKKSKYVILGVTGPNEYENNVNNNWYTNKIAIWTLKYTLESLAFVKRKNKFSKLAKKIKFSQHETKEWLKIIENIYLPFDNKLKIFLQQEGYLDKELISADDIPRNEKPLNHHWSWDRILRSCFIKQADVLQGMYFFADGFDIKTIKKHFDFYEPKTVHESSLSPCIHAILAAKIGYLNKAYEMFIRSSRLDLDNINKDTNEGCHITSMAGSWMAIVKGFAGMRVENGVLKFNPAIPKNWHSFSFKIRFRANLLNVTVSHDNVSIKNLTGKNLTVFVNNKEVLV